MNQRTTTTEQPYPRPAVTHDTGLTNSEGKHMLRTDTEVMPGVYLREYDWK